MQIGAVNQGQGNEQTQNNGSRINKQDPRIKSIQNQIENVRKRLNELSTNENMSVEQKKERRRQLNEEMQELNELLSQIQMEIQQENMKTGESPEKNKSKNNSNKYNINGNTKNNAFSENIISSDLAIKQMRELGSVKDGMEGYKKILKTQIKIDLERYDNPDMMGKANTKYKEKAIMDIQSGVRRTEKKFSEKIEEANEKLSDIEKDENNKEDEKKKSIYYSVDIKL